MHTIRQLAKDSDELHLFNICDRIETLQKAAIEFIKQEQMVRKAKKGKKL